MSNMKIKRLKLRNREEYLNQHLLKQNLCIIRDTFQNEENCRVGSRQIYTYTAATIPINFMLGT